MIRTDEERDEAHDRLLAWYAHNGRHDLPWRTTRDPYRIYLSEVMLQQTTVKTVLERFYTPFLERFPTLASVAEASLQEVLKAWEGLGYYRRARFLHAAAVACGGLLPATAAELAGLPGIGRTTANAVASFAFGEAVPILDANVKRILARLDALERPSERNLWDAADRFFNSGDPFGHNQAMMDLGAAVCTPKKPVCTACPLLSFCRGSSRPEGYPRPKIRKEIPTLYHTLVIAVSPDGRVLIKRREGELLHGLWGFPQIEADASVWVHEGDAYDLAQAQELGVLTQVYSHFRLEARVCLVRAAGATRHWIAADRLETLPMSKVDMRAWRLVK